MSSPITEKIKFTWKIKNFTTNNVLKLDSKNPLQSKKFKTSFGKYDVNEWHISLYCNGSKSTLAIFFEKDQGFNNCILLNMSVKLMDYELLAYDNKDMSKVYGWGWNSSFIVSELFRTSNKHRYIENNCLTLDIEVDLTKIPQHNDNNKIDLTLYMSKSFSDFTFISSDDGEFPVHRAIIAKKSQVFMNMFTTNMAEKEAKTAKLIDISSDTMKEALKYIYTGKISLDNLTSTTNVLYFADKYEIADLKTICIEKLMNKVDKDNVLEILITADLYDIYELAKTCYPIIVNNFIEISESEMWNDLDLSLIMKIMKEFSKQQHLVIENSL